MSARAVSPPRSHDHTIQSILDQSEDGPGVPNALIRVLKWPGDKNDVRLKQWNGDFWEQRIDQEVNCGTCSSA